MVKYEQAHFSNPTESISETDQLTFTFDIFQEISYFQEKFEVWVSGNKLASLVATLVRNYDLLTHLLTDKGKV